jgi:cell division septation protein DedD
MVPEGSEKVPPQAAADPPPTETGPVPQNATAGRAVPDDSMQKAAAPNAASTGKGYTIQVASVQSAERADQILRQLTGQGYAAYTVQSQVNGKPWYRLRIGYYDQRGQAQELMTRLKADNYDPFLIKF